MINEGLPGAQSHRFEFLSGNPARIQARAMKSAIRFQQRAENGCPAWIMSPFYKARAPV